MSLEHAVNVNSLRIIREELDITLQRASGEFEAYLADPGNHAALSQCRQDIAQIGGTLRLIELRGAALLADEMAVNAQELEQRLRGEPAGSGADPAAGAGKQRAGPASESELAALSNAFVVLPRYLELIARQQSALPILILPWVNQLRAARRAAFIPEHHFENWQAPGLNSLDWPARPAAGAAVKRLRGMFQAGLLAAIKRANGNGNGTGSRVGPTGELMARAAQRVSELFPASAGGGILPALAGVTAAFARGDLELNLNRKRSLASAEQLLGKLQRQGATAFDDPTVDTLREELLFMLALAEPDPNDTGAAEPSLPSRIRRAFGLTSLSPTDRQLSAQRQALQGPGGDTIDSVVAALRDELRIVKETLEIGSQNQGLLDDDLLPLCQVVDRIADTLTVLNLNAPAQALRLQLTSVERWKGHSGEVKLEEFQAVADAVLFVESCLSALARHQLQPADLIEFDPAQRDRIIAESHLAEARAIVVQEAQGGITMAKRAITAYVESGFDRTHIANVATALNSIRGGLAALGYERAAAVVQSSGAFVEHHLSDRKADTQAHQLLETLADALISLEYYLGELEAGGHVDDKILGIAEESLAALGFAVAVSVDN